MNTIKNGHPPAISIKKCPLTAIALSAAAILLTASSSQNAAIPICTQLDKLLLRL
jgi:hypothetical protein